MPVREAEAQYSDDSRYADIERCGYWLPRAKRYCKHAWVLRNEDGTFVCRRHWDRNKVLTTA
jgi:hypothetical protein